MKVLTRKEFIANANKKSKADLQFLSDSYYGSGGFATGSYIEKYNKESDEKYSSRKKIAYYLNYCAPVVDAYTGHIYKKNILRQSQNSNLQNFIDGFVDIARLNRLTDIMQQVRLYTGILGHCYIIVDKANQLNGISQADEQYPYVYVVDPLSVVDSSNNWLLLQNEIKTNDKNPLVKEEVLAEYFLWYRNDDETATWERIDKEGNILETKELPCYPVVKARGFNEMSEISDIATVNRRIYNLCSEIDDLLRSQTFAILTYPTDNPNSLKDIELGTDRILTYGAGGGVPSFIAPPASAIDAYEHRLEKLIDEIYRIASLHHSVQGTAVQSGVSIAYRFEQTNQKLQAKANLLKTAEILILNIVATFMGIENPDIKIEYPKDFQMEVLTDEIRTAFETLSLNLGDKFNAEYKKMVAMKLIPNVSAKIKQEIMDDIDSMPMPIESMPEDSSTEDFNE